MKSSGCGQPAPIIFAPFERRLPKVEAGSIESNIVRCELPTVRAVTVRRRPRKRQAESSRR